MVPVLFSDFLSLAWSSNNLKWDFMQDLFSMKWEKKSPEALSRKQFLHQIFRHKAKTHFCSLQISSICLISIVSNKGATKQHSCRSLELEGFQNLKCEACGFLSTWKTYFGTYWISVVMPIVMLIFQIFVAHNLLLCLLFDLESANKLSWVSSPGF